MHRAIQAIVACAAAVLLLLPALPAGAVGPAPKLIGTIHIPGTAGRWDVASIDEASQRLYLSDTTNQTLDVVDLTKGAVIAQIPGLPNHPDQKGGNHGSNGVVIAPDLHKVFVSDEGDNSVHVFDTTSDTQVGVIPTTQEGTDAIAYEPVHKKVYATNADSKTITMIGATADTVGGQIALPSSPELSAWDPFDGTLHQNPSSANQQAVIVTNTDTINYIFNLPPGCSPHGLAFDPRTQHEVIGCGNQMTVVMDGGDGSILSLTRHVGGNDAAIYDPVDDRFYVAASGFKPGPVLGAIDATTNDWVANAKTDTGAHTLAVNDKNGWVYVAAQKAGNLLIFAP